MSFSTRSFTAIALLAALSLGGQAHELQDNRATLVLREGNHVTLTLYVGYSELLHRAMGVPVPMARFLAQSAAMPSVEFQTALERTQRALQAQIQIRGSDGQLLALQGCKWPSAASIHALLRQRAMASMVGDASHDHEEPQQVQCELQSKHPLHALSVAFPAAFQRVLVVSYQPHQAWVNGGRKGQTVVF